MSGDEIIKATRERLPASPDPDLIQDVDTPMIEINGSIQRDQHKVEHYLARYVWRLLVRFI